MDTEQIQNDLSRTAKILMDAREANSIEEAYRILQSYRLSVRVGADVADSPTLQAALLTMVNTARRCFLGGVEVAGCPPAELLVRLPGAETIQGAIEQLQGTLTYERESEHPEIVIGGARPSTSSEFAVRATFDGWVGGVAPAVDDIRLAESHEFTPAGVLAGSLAVAEAFQFARGRNPLAGRRSIGLSLWEPHSEEDWTSIVDRGPELEILPSRLWLIGLGHLGQAYLWTLGLLPFATPSEVQLILQDTDRLTKANDSTSPLTNAGVVGRYKTRAMADWCEARGFDNRIIERSFAADFKISGEDPAFALCGVDNGPARAALEDVGFARVFEAGLGRGTEEYLAFQVHSFPGRKPARKIWDPAALPLPDEPSTDAPAYADLGGKGVDKCGQTMVAGRAVGASFVGAFTSTLVIAEVLRTLAGGPAYDVIDGTLRAPEKLLAVPKAEQLQSSNPGFTLAMPISAARGDGIRTPVRIEEEVKD